MPTRVSMQPAVANTSAFASQSRDSSASRGEDSGSGEGPARKRFLKSTSDGDILNRRNKTGASSTKPATESRSNLAARRRQSTRDQKAPLGPRPAAFSPTKRTAAASHAHETSTTNATSHPRRTSVNHRARYSITSLHSNTQDDKDANSSSGINFLPEVSFDDFHMNLTADEPTLNQFPAPVRGGSILRSEGLNHNTQTRLAQKQETKGSGTGPVEGSTTRGIARSGSLLRRNNSNSTQRLNQAVPSTESMGQPSAPVSTRPRRQSYFPTSNSTSHVALARAPRKSVGPGILPTEFGERASHRRKSSIRHVPNDQEESESEGVRLGAPAKLSSSHSIPRFTSTTNRTVKSKSLQPPPREPRSHLSTPSRTPDHSRSSSTTTTRTPGRSVAEGATTPSSSRRMSVMPPHASGLGARTISPTDARRMKRQSIMPHPPPLPTTPTTPQPELSLSGTQSPAQVHRKSTTPSSSRTTPDPNRKSYSSGLSVSSSTSYNSVRNSMGSNQSRLSQNLNLSRLPTAKTRSDNSFGEDEDVPPVPAIPKAFESPSAEHESFFSGRKGSFPFETDSMRSVSTGEGTPTLFSTLEKARSREEAEGRRLAINTAIPSESEAKAKGSSLGKKSHLQPLRLPPLNLLPLSTPTAAKIAALHEPATNHGDPITPPPPKRATKTPSTPMTASKASFFSRGDQAPTPLTVKHVRSSSSHYQLRNESPLRGQSSSMAANVPTPSELRPAPRAVSPFTSSSLPKHSGEFSFIHRKGSGDYAANNAAGADHPTSKLTGPRAQTWENRKHDTAPVQLPSPLEPEATSLGASLRRKLSLTRKKSASRSQVGTEPSTELKKSDNMPPPKLPASATWTGHLHGNSTQQQRAARLQNRRNVSNASIGGHARISSDNGGTGDGSYTEATTGTEASESEAPSTSSRTGHSIPTPVQKMPAPRHRPLLDMSLDRDDLGAEEEMKRLASKRKDFESAARELDQLRKKATVKERVSPNQALRMANLNIFERGEIVDYKDVYFCGTKHAKKHVGDMNSASLNFGYDDDRGDYKVIHGDHIAYRYEVIDVLGKGSFGQVLRCIDHRTGGLVAIKIIRNKKRFHQQALVEVNILQKLREWDPDCQHSVVNFTQSFYFRGHLCISTELLGMNLYEFIKAHDFRGFSLRLIRRFTKQMLSSLLLLHAHKVIHCDLKPENILLAHPVHSEIKVIDFGSSCFENEKVYTYIQSRFYRSPEVILGMTYGMPIDMWSLGCILAELYTGYPIFPGENEQEQLACIMEVFGPPEKHLIEKSSRKKLFFDSLGKPRITVSSKGRRRRPSSKSLHQALKCDDEAFLDFIARCLRWDPARRLTPHEAACHEFITGIKPTAVPRSRGALSNFNSPIKRNNTVQTPAGARPLPEPPATSFKNGTAVRNRDPSNSPIKAGGAARRHSTMNGLQGGIGIKRASNGNMVAGSALPRVPTRSFSGKPDLAAAAAAASLKTR